MNGIQEADHELYAVRASWVVPMTGGSSDDLLEDGIVLFRGSIILSVGVFDSVQLDPSVPVLHLEDQIIIPGLVNCHTHSGMSLLRGFADDMSLHEWLSDAVWPAESKFVNPDYIRVGTKLAIYELLKTGTTTFLDQYFHCDVAAEVAEKVGIRIGCGEPIIDFHDGHLHNKIERAFEQVALFAGTHNPDYVIPLINTHACYTVPEDGLELVSARAKALGTKVNIHLHESQHECDHYADTHAGKSAFQTLIDAGLFNSNLIAAHCVCLSQSERELLRTHKVNVVHCPKSNMKLASGICPVQSLINAGVNVALGTDGACSNNGLSMLSEMQAAALVGKTVRSNSGVAQQYVAGGDATAVSCHTALRMATYNGAIALGMEDRIGSIEPGKWADFVAIDLSSPECQPVFDPVSALVYTTGAKVSNVWIGGRRLVKNGSVAADLDLDMEQVKSVGRDIADFQRRRKKEQQARLESILSQSS